MSARPESGERSRTRPGAGVTGDEVAFARDRFGWSLPPDEGMLDAAAVRRILAADDYPVCTSYRTRVIYTDFRKYGQSFTQATLILEPDRPRLHRGKKIVVVAGEPGSEYGPDFLQTPGGHEGPGPWLARRGVTFVGLTRVGRWNFLDPQGMGSWAGVPLEQRMPIFNRQQRAHWTAADYRVEHHPLPAPGPSDSRTCRVPVEGSPLHAQMLAAAPPTFVEGYRRGVEAAIPPSKRAQCHVLFWGLSTGGAFLYPLARYWLPDGYLGWATSSTGLASALGRAQAGDFSRLYTASALRVRERGADDFGFYTQGLSDATRDAWWQASLSSPRFKSGEDAAMLFNPGALAEIAFRLWRADFLPEEDRRAGPVRLLLDMLEPSLPAQELAQVPILDMNGTRDPTIPPAAVDRHREIMAFYARRYRVLRIQDLEHYLFDPAHIKVVGTVWLRVIEHGFFG